MNESEKIKDFKKYLDDCYEIKDKSFYFICKTSFEIKTLKKYHDKIYDL